MNFKDFFMSGMLFVFAVICVGSLTKVVLALINRRATQAALPPQVMERLERIEQIVETTAVEVERVAEAQRFTTRVLTDRATASGLPATHAHGRVNTPH